MREPLRWCALLAAAWFGVLVAVAAIATPAAFAALPVADAGRVVARVLAREAQASLLLGIATALVLRVHARRRANLGQVGGAFSLELGLALGALFCTVAGYHGIQPWMAEARSGSGRLTFAQLHAASAAFYGLKTVLVAVLAWRSVALLSQPPSSSG
jgi:hypothetical protein